MSFYRVVRNCRISDHLATVNFSNLEGLTLLSIFSSKIYVSWPRDLSFNNITGQIPQSILNLDRLGFL
nr:unnamed protein product [Digitaria exilis]